MLDVPWNAAPRIHIGGSDAITLSTQMVRARVTAENVCLELAGGTLAANGDDIKKFLVRSPRAAASTHPGDMRVSVLSDRVRYALRCTAD